MERFEFICHVFIHVSIFVQPTKKKYISLSVYRLLLIPQLFCELSLVHCVYMYIHYNYATSDESTSTLNFKHFENL